MATTARVLMHLSPRLSYSRMHEAAGELCSDYGDVTIYELPGEQFVVLRASDDEPEDVVQTIGTIYSDIRE